jgi:xylan 1,4-beta-xylosidase
MFHDEMSVVTGRKDGSLCFQWHQIDRIFDVLLHLGIRPFVELNPMRWPSPPATRPSSTSA